jgi:hypothetical protein
MGRADLALFEPPTAIEWAAAGSTDDRGDP